MTHTDTTTTEVVTTRDILAELKADLRARREPGEALEFSGRDDYLAHRREWRRTYREISQTIRGHKQAMRAAENDYDRSSAQMRREAERCTARQLLEVRAKAKELARAASAALRQQPKAA